jgi:type I restriction enzyme S subunit
MNNNKTTYKDSPLGKITYDWKVVRISDYGKVYTGNTPPTNDLENYGVEFLFVSPSDLGSDKYILNTEKKLSKKGFSVSRKFPPGSVLFTCIGSTIGKAGVASIELTSNQQINAIVVDGKYSNEFLYYALENNADKIRLLAGEQAVPILNKSQFESVKIICPPFPEQKAIAHILGLMDTAINKNNSLIAKKELQKKWLMKNLLTGKKRVKGFEKEGWEETSLGNLFERVTRKNIEQNSNVVTISAQRGFVRQTDFFNKSIASEIVDNYFLVEKGEFCYNKSYSNGYPWGATKRLKDFDKAVVTTLYICFGLKNSQKNSGDFFEQYFEANLLDKGLTKIAHEGGRAHGLLNVTPSDFFSLKITIPTPDEQTAIAKVLKAADKEIQLLKAKTEKLREQKKGLMQVLLTGRKRLKIVRENQI